MTAGHPSFGAVGDAEIVRRIKLLLHTAHARFSARLAVMFPDLRATADRSGLVLLILSIVALLFRPADLLPGLAGASIYEYLIGACFFISLPKVLPQLSPRSLGSNGITAAFLLLVPAVMLSHLAGGNFYEARVGGLEIAKACVLLLLIVGLVDTQRKLRMLLFTVMVGVLAMTVAALLQYHGYLNLPALRTIEQHSPDGEGAVILRLCGIGVFNDPNDYSLILVTALVVSTAVLLERTLGRPRWLALIPLALFAYALVLTHSRGGLLSALGALLVFVPARFGWRNTLPLILLLAPPLLMPFWDRLTDLDNPEDSFQTRLELWSNSLDAFRSAPVLGIGQGKLVDEIGQVAHNSYLHAFAELGLLGGTAFLGGFVLAVLGTWRAAPADPNLARLRPYMLAIVVGYAAGILSLSRCYTVPTQLIPATATVYASLSSLPGRSALPRLTSLKVLCLLALSALFLGGTLLFVRLLWQEVHV